VRRPALELPALSEMVAIVLGLLILTGLLYGPYALHGGFLLDDWDIAQGHRFGIPVSHGLRFVYAAYQSGIYSLFGPDPIAAYLVSAALIAALLSVVLFVFLRAVGVGRCGAIAVAALSLASPLADSTRLWYNASEFQLAVILVLVGAMIALWGLELGGLKGVATHVLAMACYVLSLFSYEIVAGSVVIAGALYWRKSSWRAARWRWGADLAAVVPCLVLIAANTPKPTSSVARALKHAAILAAQPVTLVGSLGVASRNGPYTVLHALLQPLTLFVLVAAVLVVVRAVALVRQLGPEDRRYAEVRRWLRFLVAGCIAVASAYVILIPSVGYAPLSPGNNNRINVAGAPALIFVIYTLLVLGSLTVLRRDRAHRAPLIALGASALLLIGYSTRLLSDERALRRSHDLQQTALNVLWSSVPSPPPRTVLFAFGLPAQTAPGVPVFGAPWDLTGAIRLHWDDPTLAAIPEGSITDLACTGTGIRPIGPLYQPGVVIGYAASRLVDLRTGRNSEVFSTTSCRRLLPRFLSAPDSGRRFPTL
jgi:hypothetical protein